MNVIMKRSCQAIRELPTLVSDSLMCICIFCGDLHTELGGGVNGVLGNNEDEPYR